MNGRVAVQDKAEAKLKALEAKAEEQRKVKEAADAQWQAAQREREIKRRQVRLSLRSTESISIL